MFFLAIAGSVSAQQHALYSQYIFNLYMINPAYAGSRDALSANIGYRAQWVGFEGSPKTQNFSLHGPLRNKNMAVGIQFQNDEIGARNATSVSGTYAYSINLGHAQRLRFGLQGGLINYRMDWNALNYDERSDPAAWTNDPNRWIPNFDFGVMYTSAKAYAGISAVNLSQPALSSNDLGDARLSTHFHLMAGKVFEMNENIALKPGFLVRHTAGGPVSFDFSIGALLSNRFWVTAAYRYGFGMVGATHVYVTDKIHIGYAYDWTLNPMMTYQSGSHEIFIGYDLNIYRARQTTPRYF